MGARLGDNFVWSKEFVGEFVGGSSQMEKLHLDECLAANIEFWSQIMMGVS